MVGGRNYLVSVDEASQAADDCGVDEWLCDLEDGGQAQGLHHDFIIELVILGLNKVLVEGGGEAQDDCVCDDEPDEPVLLALAVVDVQEGVPPEQERVEKALEEGRGGDVEIVPILPMDNLKKYSG